jgi:hypothetical protein
VDDTPSVISVNTCTDKEMNAIQTLPAQAWTAGID